MNKKIIFIFFLALAARLAYWGLTPARPMNWDDAASWDNVGWNVAQGNGFLESENLPTFFRPPVYPLMLAALYKTFGHNVEIAKLVQIFLSALTCVMIFFLAKSVFDEKTGLFSAFLCAVYPPLIIYSAIIGSETLYVFLLVLTIWMLTEAVQKFSAAKFIFSGAVLGVTNLCRSTLLFYPFFLAPVLWLRGFKKEFFLMILTAAVSFLVVSPWTVRNYKVFGGFLMVNISAGQLFWVGTLQDTHGSYVESENYEGYKQFAHITNPIDLERSSFKAGLENIKANPAGYAKLTVLKFFRQWFEPIGYTLTKKRSEFLALVLGGVHTVFVLLAFYGVFKSIPKMDSLLPLYVVLIYFALMHNVIAPMPRFRLPFEPFLILFAVWGIRDVAGRFSRSI